MTRTGALAARVLAVVCLLAGCSSGTPIDIDQARPVAHVQPVPDRPGPRTEVEHRAAAARWVKGVLDGAWYAWASALPDPAKLAAHGHTGRNPGPVDLSGDRFDRLAACESGGDPTTDTGNGYSGAFQWLPSTWTAAGGTGDPAAASYEEQKRIAMSWAERSNPYGQWPVCWPRSA